ncbi:hypothetical protein [Amphiplicatus metriothermophilus]|uniref:Uncharacterized protein n=1 Tax=Amphiplicatus metriothermophilus TaxID=1519374 RepID=A0A239PVP1_9PROT|nr:hypothetical protein [Amphiplicatus metriothermophilus]MBB5519536.1 hypothetical protein [Amphiplicatus metriothermophilus]SNT74103.1 hypothetical protein SAMN06297382_2008 [Amphiplicatus metriothermophilus]
MAVKNMGLTLGAGVVFAAIALIPAGLANSSAASTPLAKSCAVLDVIGTDRTDGLAPLFADLGAHWPKENREGLINRLTELLGALDFAGGNVYLLNKFGDDLEEHLVLLRLAGGEVAGMRLRYEWTPAGMKLVTVNFERKYQDYVPDVAGGSFQKLPCL